MDTFEYGKCLETEEITKSLVIISRDFVVILFLDTFENGKCLETGEMIKSLEIMTFQGDLSFPLFPDTSTEPSAAGARRGVSNCIQTNCIQTNDDPARPAGRRPARACVDKYLNFLCFYLCQGVARI